GPEGASDDRGSSHGEELSDDERAKALLDDIVDPSSVDLPADRDGLIDQTAVAAESAAADDAPPTDRGTDIGDEPEPDDELLYDVAPPLGEDPSSVPLPDIGLSEGT